MVCVVLDRGQVAGGTLQPALEEQIDLRKAIFPGEQEKTPAGKPGEGQQTQRLPFNTLKVPQREPD